VGKFSIFEIYINCWLDSVYPEAVEPLHILV